MKIIIKFGPVIMKMLSKDISIFSSIHHFVLQITTVYAILAEGIMRNIFLKLFLTWASG